MRELVPYLIVVGIFALIVYRFLEALYRIARALESLEIPLNVKVLAPSPLPSNEEIWAKVGELQRDNAVTLEQFKREINRVDRTIERNAVRPKRQRTVEIDDLTIPYVCPSCGWKGEFASADPVNPDKTMCPSCMKEIPKAIS